LFRNPIAKSATFIEQLQNFFNISKDDKVKYFSFATNAYTDEEAAERGHQKKEAKAELPIKLKENYRDRFKRLYKEKNDWHKRFEKKNG
jgi:hypothetical protein